MYRQLKFELLTTAKNCLYKENKLKKLYLKIIGILRNVLVERLQKID